MIIGPVLMLASLGLVRLTDRLGTPARAAALLVLLLPALRLDLDILRAPEAAALPEIDRGQFVSGWPSGYGTAGTLAFVREELGRHPGGLTVVTHVHARRTTWQALGLEFAHEPRVELRDLDLNRRENLDVLAAWSHSRPTLVVLSPVGPARRPVNPKRFAHLGGLALRSCKPGGGFCDEVYRLGVGPRSEDS
jgi:hypothetical protein